MQLVPGAVATGSRPKSTVEIVKSDPVATTPGTDLVSWVNAQHRTRRVANYKLGSVGQIRISAGTQRRGDRDQVGFVTASMLDHRLADASQQSAEPLKLFC